jgi:hypothetical protein
MDPSSIIAGGVGGLLNLFGGLAEAAQKRKQMQMEGELKSAQTKAEAEGVSALTQADKERAAFENMMGAYGRTL